MSSIYLIVDGNNISFRASSVIPAGRLINDDINTGLLWGMLNKRIRCLHEDGYDEVIPVFTFDAPHNVIGQSDAVIDRYSMDIHYKENRRDDGTDPNRAELDNARNKWRQKWIYEIMDKEMALIQYPGVEADDLMSYSADLLTSKTSASVGIWTMDKDLMQCVNDDKHVSMYRYRRGKGDVLVNEKEVLEEKHVPASKIRLQLALQGDSSDNYPGVKGYGGKRGIKLIMDSNSIDDIINALPDYANQLNFNYTLAGVGGDYMPSESKVMADQILGTVI